MEGSIVITDDKLYECILRAHGWTRNLPDNSNIYSKSEDKFYDLSISLCNIIYDPGAFWCY